MDPNVDVRKGIWILGERSSEAKSEVERNDDH